MRLVPAPMYFRARAQDVLRFASESTRTTHATREAIDCSRLFGLQLRAALLGASKCDILATAAPEQLVMCVEIETLADQLLGGSVPC